MVWHSWLRMDSQYQLISIELVALTIVQTCAVQLAFTELGHTITDAFVG